MSGRTPSFIVVGLIIIMFLLGFFYMSCSSKNTELQLSLGEFEERIRSLTLKHNELERKYENLNSRKRELEEDKLTMQRQLEKKDSELNDLNTKFNEKQAEFQSINSDKKVLDEQLKDYKSVSDTLAAKNALIEKLQQQLNEQKQASNDELTRLKQEYETNKNNRVPRNDQAQSNNEQRNDFIIPPQRFRPFPTNNYTTKSLSSLFQDPLNKLNNLTKEIKAQMVPAISDVQNQVLNAFGLNTNSSSTPIINQQQQPAGNNDKQEQQQANQNVPPPPLANYAQRQQQPGHIESAQAAPQPAQDQAPAADNGQYEGRLQQSLNNSIADNRNNKFADRNENDDEEQIGGDNVQENNKPVKQEYFKNDNPPVGDNNLLNRENNRIARRKFRKSGTFIRQRQQQQQQEQLDNGEELNVEHDDNNNDNQYQRGRKRNFV